MMLINVTRKNSLPILTLSSAYAKSRISSTKYKSYLSFIFYSKYETVFIIFCISINFAFLQTNLPNSS